MKQKEKILTWDFALLFVVSLLVYLSMNMLNVIIPLYVTETLGGTAALVGVMTTVYEVASCGARPFCGLGVDARGERGIMLFGCLVFGVGCVVCGLVPTIAAAVFARALMGIGFAGATTANNTASTKVIPASRLEEGVGYFGIGQAAGAALGSALASVIVVVATGQQSLFLVGLICFAGVALSVFYRRGNTVPEKGKTGREEKRVVIFERNAVLPSLVEFFTLFLLSCPMCFITLYIVSIGLPRQTAGMFFAVSSVVIVALRTFGSRFLKDKSPVLFLLPSYAALIITMYLLTDAESTAALLGISVLYGLAHGGSWMVLCSEAIRRSPAERRGAANATFFFAFDAAISFGAVFWGWIIDRLGYESGFYLVMVGAVLLAVISAFVFGKKGSRSRIAAHPADQNEETRG